MAYRGTLKQCITCACLNFTAHNYEMIAITHNLRGKYYTCARADETEKGQPYSVNATHRVVFFGTALELAHFALHEQLNLFSKEVPHDDPQNHPERQLANGEHPDPLALNDEAETGQ